MADFKTDTSAIRVEPNKGMSLSDMLNISRGALEYKKEQELYQPAVEAAKAQSRTAQATASKAEQLMPLEVESAQTGLNTQKLQNLVTHSNATINGIQKLFNKENLTHEDIIKEATELNKIHGGSAESLAKTLQSLPANASPIQLKAWLAQQQASTVGSLAQFEKLYPDISMTSTGNKIVPITQGNPFTSALPPGMQVGQGVELGLPPTTPVQGASGEMTYLGAVPPNTNIVSEQGPMFRQMAKIATEDFERTQNEAKDVQTRKATFQKIKQLSGEAFTSVGGAKKELLSGIAQAVGIPAYELEKTATDELAKNSAILQLAGGNTDAARQIAEIANPNKKLTKDAITNVSNQLIGIENLKEAKNNFLTPYAKNPEEYTKRLNEWNKVSDYRIFQDMTPAEVAKIKSGMSATEQKEMSEKIALARKLGIIK
jgi:hypothetical protein